MQKRLISFLCALLMLVGLLPRTAYAAETETTGVPVVSVEQVWANSGQTVEIDLSIANNPGIIGGIFTVSWAEGLELISAKNKDTFGELNYQKPSGFIREGTNFMWYGDSVSEVLDGVFLTLTFKVADNITIYKNLAINVIAKNVVNANKETISVNCISGGIEVINYFPGDVSDDGVIDMFDITDLAQYISDNCITNPNGFNVSINDSAADVDDNGKIDMLDLILICQYVSDDCETRPDGHNVTLKPSTPKCSHTMEAVAYKAPTCTEPGDVEHYHCTTCGKYYNDDKGTLEIDPFGKVPATGHVYATEWSFDQTYHWHAATCEHSELVSERGEHNFGTDKMCTVCKMSNAPDPSKPYMITYKLVEYNKQNGDTYLETLNIDNSQNRTWFSATDSFELEDPSCGEAYTFNGWYTEDGTKVTRISAGTKEDITLYARWTERTFTITYNVYNTPVGAITDVSKKSYKPSQGLAELPKPDLNNYIWQGWFFEDGTEATNIPVGTTGHIVLIPHLTNERNLAIPKQDSQPLIVEDTENGVILFAYELGTIKNVPLTDALWEIQSVAGLEQQQSKTYTSEISEEKAVSITDMISDTTVDSSTWTLSENWTDTVEVNETWAQENSIDVETAKEQMLTDSNTISLTNSKGVSDTSTHTSGITTTMDTSVDVGKETGSHFNVNLDTKYSNTVETSAGFSAGLKVPLKGGAEGNLGLNAGIKNTSTFELGLGAEYGNYDKNTTNVHVGTEQSKVETDVNSSTSSWNSSATAARTQEISQKESISTALKEVISTTKGYGKTYSSGGEGSNTQGTSFSESSSTTTSSSLVYKSTVIEETYQMQKADGKIEGKYRLVIAGDVHVFAVVGYDVASRSYFTYTYNILDDETYSFVDYTPKGGDYGEKVYDYENSVLPFEIPYFVHEYVTSKTVVTEGIEYSTNSVTGTATVVNFNASAGVTDVIIPSYISAGGNAYKVTGITANAFAGKPIRSIILSDYITDIPANAFKDCTALEQISGRFTTIGDYAFSGCVNLENFIVSPAVSFVGEKAFEDVPSITMTALSGEYALIAAETAHPDITDTDEENLRSKLAPYAEEITKQVIQSAANSGAKNVVIDISKIAADAVLTLAVPEIDSFELIGDKKVSYTDMKITSLAKTTKLRNLTVANCTRVPLEIKAGDLILDTVNITAPSFVLLLAKDSATISLLRDSKLTAEGGNAVVAKNPVISSVKEESVWGTLYISGNFYYCGDEPDTSYLTMASGNLIPLSETEFASYIQGCFKITFNPNGGSVDKTEMTAFVGQSVGTLPVPGRIGHIFAGWFDSNNVQITESSTFATVQDITLTAKWSAMCYEVSWDTGTGYSISVNRTASPNMGASIGALDNGETVYYGDVLSVTYTASTGYTITEHGKTTITVTSNVTSNDIYAETETNSYTYKVVYVSSNGTDLGSAEVTYNYGTTNTITAPAMSGYDTPAEQSVVWDSTSAKTITFTYSPTQVSTTTKSGQVYNSSGSILYYTAKIEHQNRTATSVQIRVTWTATLTNGYNSNALWFRASVGSVSTGNVRIVSQGSWGSSASSRSATVSSEWITVPLNTTNATSVDLSAYHYQANYNGTDLSPAGYYNMSATWSVAIPAY